jgi:3'(2'), 5'-bisphosphate nucleotidase
MPGTVAGADPETLGCVSDSSVAGDLFERLQIAVDRFARKECPLRQLHPDGRELDFDSASADEIAVFLAAAAVAAGPAVMEVYQQGGDVWSKSDGSPVTLADQRAEAVVCAKLSHAFPLTPIVAEESTSSGEPASVADRFLLVDPLDGTKEFVARNGEFTINVALIRKGAPVAGAVYAPALGRLWFGGEQAFVCEAAVGAGLPDRGAWRQIAVRRAPELLVVLASRSHGESRTEGFLSRLPIAERQTKGSSLKFCVIAEGLADVYPRFGPTMEWDTAAGDAVLRAAGGVVLDPSGEPFVYGKTADGLRNGPFVAWGDAQAARRFNDC